MEEYYIEREELISQLLPMAEASENLYGGIMTAISIIKQQPAANIEPQRHGRWIINEFNVTGRPMIFCSECGSRTINIMDVEAWLVYSGHRYCGCCGAKMDENAKYV